MRINGIEVVGTEGYADLIEPGRFFLAKITEENHGCAQHYQLRDRPCRTNRSHEPKLEGWCGCTNNVDTDACGAVEVYRDKAKRLRARRCDAQALYDEVSPDCEL